MADKKDDNGAFDGNFDGMFRTDFPIMFVLKRDSVQAESLFRTG
jgi:hypothetical protein